ncbi:hypothetical protein [Novibacillus thermophilus]|uniref:hypothetical protein n=1 Tax=Novibacillus thermophilus TaxID=1471761 RepID=UPI00147298A3|nr:hypothetical protein [Novibacillus thermophilus]
MPSTPPTRISRLSHRLENTIGCRHAMGDLVRLSHVQDMSHYLYTAFMKTMVAPWATSATIRFDTT